MDNNHFSAAPNLSQDFSANAPDVGPDPDAQNWPTQDELDQLNLADRALTPGGSLEYAVHKQVSIERRTTYYENNPANTASLADEKELDFDQDFQQATEPAVENATEVPGLQMSPDELRTHIEGQLQELQQDFDRSAGVDRGGPADGIDR